MTAKTTPVLYFCYILLHDFWFLYDLELINLCLVFFNQNELYLTFKFKMVIANTQIKAVFMHVNYIFIKKYHLFNEKLKNRLRNTADQVARHSKLCLTMVYSNMFWCAEYLFNVIIYIKYICKMASILDFTINYRSDSEQ